MPVRRKILIDTDMGLGAVNTDVDDGIAILMALASPEVEVVGITSVGGNVPTGVGSTNVLRLLRRIGREEIPLAAGRAEPIGGVAETLERKWQAVEATPPTAEEQQRLASLERANGSAVEFILRSIEAHKKELTLVALGPLTNLALAAAKEPRIFKNVGEVVIMGGSTISGNASTTAEFNVWCDPEAADIVFRCGLPVTMYGLDMTTRIEVVPSTIERWQTTGSFLQFVYDSSVTYMAFRSRRYGKDHPFMYYHDAMPVASLVNPSLFETVPCWIDVELRGEYTRGMTVVDQGGRFHDGSTPHSLAVEIRSEAFQELLLGRIYDSYGEIE